MADITMPGKQALQLFFNPSSVALIGATDREGATGRIVLENLLPPSQQRRVYAVNPSREYALGLKCYPAVDALPEKPDLAVIVTPAETVPKQVEACGCTGVKAVIIISAGFKEIGDEGVAREQEITAVARKYGVRVIGPNCMGIIRPISGLNTTFIRKMPQAGYVAFLSQSGALGAGILDWAIRRNMGFSAFVSLGSMLDVDFGDAIDYFGEDPETRSIIIYPESLGSVKKFMSAARGFARSKPIIVLKPGKFEESARAVRSHTGSMVGEDLHYDAIFHRAGVVRVEELRDLFNCASILDSAKLPGGASVAIITNGGGPAVLAIDNLISRGGKLATLSETTLATLDRLLPPNWSRANPVDIREDADTRRYANAIEAVVADPGVNGIIVIYTPQGRAHASEVAEAVIGQAHNTGKPVLAVWIGADEAAAARELFADNKLPAFDFPEEAIKAYVYMWQYARNLDMLYQTPEESKTAGASRHHLKAIIRKALRDGRTLLLEEDSSRFLSTYHIPTTKPEMARTPDDAVNLAGHTGYPVVLKIASADIAHKSDVGGVVCDIKSPEAVKATYQQIVSSVEKCNPAARIDGVSVHNFVAHYDYELIVGAKKDLVCGPVIMFGLGGKEAEYLHDFAVGLPPLNRVLARRIIEHTRIYERLANGSRNKPPVDLRRLSDILVNVADLMVDFPEIQELDINPLLVAGENIIAVDTRILLDPDAVGRDVPEYSHLVISPYPTRYVMPWLCKDGRQVLLRPVKPEDEEMERQELEALTEESLRLRFFTAPQKISHEMLVRFCNVDYDREMVIIAEYNSGGQRRSVGNSRLLVLPDGLSGEFAVVVAEDFRNVGLGLKLMDMIIGIAREKGLQRLIGITMHENSRMINLAKRLGFVINRASSDDVTMKLEL